MEKYELDNLIVEILKLLIDKENNGVTTLIYSDKLKFNNFIKEFKTKAIDSNNDKSFDKLSNIKKLERIFEELDFESTIDLLKKIKKHIFSIKILNNKNLENSAKKIINLIESFLNENKKKFTIIEDINKLIYQILEENDFKIKCKKLGLFYSFLDGRENREKLKSFFGKKIVNDVFIKLNNNGEIRHKGNKLISEEEFIDLFEKITTFSYFIELDNLLKNKKKDLNNNKIKQNIFYIDGAISSNKNNVGLIAIVDNKGKLLYRSENPDCEWSNEIEAFAFLEFIKYLLKNKILKAFFYDDNKTIISWIKTRKINSKTKAKDYMKKAFSLIDENNIKIEVEYIKGIDNLADKYTREI